MKNKFRIISSKISVWAGSPLAFVSAIFVICIWALSGPAANYSDTWQLVINTGTTIVTFLMVFLIQNTQNRDSKAMQLKLDELIRSNNKARDAFVSLEDISDDELLEITEQFRKLHEKSTPNKAMRKLHEKIEAETTKRQSLKGKAISIANNILDPFGTNSNNQKNK